MAHDIARRHVMPSTENDMAFLLEAEGFCIARDLLPASSIGALDADFAKRFLETPFCVGDFYGAQTKRFGRLLTRSGHMVDLVMHPIIRALADRMLKPWCDTIQLNLTQAIEIHPGALAQLPHRDQDMWPDAAGSHEYLLNVIWPLTPFAYDNGATLLWPDSHGRLALEDPASLPVVAEARPGDTIIFLGSTLHGAGANASERPRRGLVIGYSLGWLKPYENPWLAYPPEIAAGFSSELAALAGYRQHRPNLGNYEGLCPSVLLGPAQDRDAGATDALRPEQAAALADYVRAQRSGDASSGALGAR